MRPGTTPYEGFLGVVNHSSASGLTDIVGDVVKQAKLGFVVFDEIMACLPSSPNHETAAVQCRFLSCGDVDCSSLSSRQAVPLRSRVNCVYEYVSSDVSL